ncbi:unnamed protein product, partial [Mesorhabditis spiculigera]
MSFPDLPREVQYRILNHLDLLSFFKYAKSSKKSWEIAATCPDKYWNLALVVKPEDQLTVYPNHLRNWLVNDEKTRLLLFSGALVASLRIQDPDFRIPGLTAKNLELDDTGADLMPMLEYFKPAGKFESLNFWYLRPNSEIAQFAEKHASNLFIRSYTYLINYSEFKNDRMKVEVPRPLNHKFIPFLERLVEEWLNGSRKIAEIEILALGIGPSSLNGLSKYTRHIDPHRATIKRCDGGVLVVSSVTDRFWPYVELVGEEPNAEFLYQ